jgi:multimeric flavodoxin WrbA
MLSKKKDLGMKIVCISAANIEVARHNSASVHTCELIRDMVIEEDSAHRVDIVPLIDYEMKPCRMCGLCFKTQRCARDDAFNRLFEKMIASDAIFFVIPHYAPLPSKLMMLTEKMQEIAFLHWCYDSAYRFPLAGIPTGVIGHGGQPTSVETNAYYHRMLVEPVANALSAVSMQVMGMEQDGTRGAAFGIRSINRRPDSIFVDIQHDWDDIRQRITPLVRLVVAAATSGDLEQEN